MVYLRPWSNDFAKKGLSYCYAVRISDGSDQSAPENLPDRDRRHSFAPFQGASRLR